jgi:protease-4
MYKTFNGYLKTAFFILVIINLAPPLIKNISRKLEQKTNPTNKVGHLVINEAIYSSTPYSKDLHAFFKNPDIKAVILKIDCPGGAAGSSQALMHEIERLKAKYPKPIVCYIENICASGGYYVAVATDHIVATGSAIVGSIGSKITTQFKVKNLLKKYDIETETIASGKYKSLLDPFSEITAEQRQSLQNISDDSYHQFVADIAQRRHLSIENSEAWAEGQIFTGKQAYDLHLVDKIGTFSSAIEFVKKHIIPSNRKIELVEVTPKNRFSELFQSSGESFDTGLYQSIEDRLLTKFVQFLETPQINSL